MAQPTTPFQFTFAASTPSPVSFQNRAPTHSQKERTPSRVPARARRHLTLTPESDPSSSDDEGDGEEEEEEEPAPFLPHSTALSDLAHTLESIKLTAGTSDLESLRHVGFTKYLPASVSDKKLSSIKTGAGPDSVDLREVMRRTSLLDAAALDDRGWYKEVEEPGEHERDVVYHVRRLCAAREAQQSKDDDDDDKADEDKAGEEEDEEDGEGFSAERERGAEENLDDGDEDKPSVHGFTHNFVPGPAIDKQPVSIFPHTYHTHMELTIHS